MSFIKNIISEEKERLNDLLKVYQKKLSLFPKGSLVERDISGKSYIYIHFRQDSKVISKYIGKKDSPDHKLILDKIEHRKKIKSKIKEVQNELKEINKLKK